MARVKGVPRLVGREEGAVELDESTVEVRPAPSCADGSERVGEDAGSVEKRGRLWIEAGTSPGGGSGGSEEKEERALWWPAACHLMHPIQEPVFSEPSYSPRELSCLVHMKSALVARQSAKINTTKELTCGIEGQGNTILTLLCLSMPGTAHARMLIAWLKCITR